MNADGGVSGRKIVPVFDQFCPIPNAALLAEVCTTFTDDDKVFAVVGDFVDLTGEARRASPSSTSTVLVST